MAHGVGDFFWVLIADFEVVFVDEGATGRGVGVFLLKASSYGCFTR